MTDIRQPEAIPSDGEIFLFPGAAGALEVAIRCPPASLDRQAVALLCHPHPLHGGTMDNKVVTTTERALRELGITTVRFNFRGVGKSAGDYDDGRGETLDVLALAAWLQRVRPAAALWLAGFSFGSYVALNAAQALPVRQLVTIAPPVDRYDFKRLKPPACPWLVVMGDADDVVDAPSVVAWAKTLEPPPALVRMEGAGHFFHGRLIELRQAIQQHVSPNLPPHAAA